MRNTWYCWFNLIDYASEAKITGCPRPSTRPILQAGLLEFVSLMSMAGSAVPFDYAPFVRALSPCTPPWTTPVLHDQRGYPRKTSPPWSDIGPTTPPLPMRTFPLPREADRASRRIPPAARSPPPTSTSLHPPTTSPSTRTGRTTWTPPATDATRRTPRRAGRRTWRWPTGVRDRRSRRTSGCPQSSGGASDTRGGTGWSDENKGREGRECVPFPAGAGRGLPLTSRAEERASPLAPRTPPVGGVGAAGLRCCGTAPPSEAGFGVGGRRTPSETMIVENFRESTSSAPGCQGSIGAAWWGVGLRGFEVAVSCFPFVAVYGTWQSKAGG